MVWSLSLGQVSLWRKSALHLHLLRAMASPLSSNLLNQPSLQSSCNEAAGTAPTLPLVLKMPYLTLIDIGNSSFLREGCTMSSAAFEFSTSPDPEPVKGF